MRLAISIILILLVPLQVLGEVPERAIVKYKGVNGYWFNEEIGNNLLKDVSSLNITKKKIFEFEGKLVLKDEKIKFLLLNIDITEQISDKWKEAFGQQAILAQKEQVRYDALRDKESKWYRSNVLWFGVGVLFSSIIAIGMAYGLKEARK